MSTDTAREAARHDNGQFGEQPLTDPGPAVLQPGIPTEVTTADQLKPGNSVYRWDQWRTVHELHTGEDGDIVANVEGGLFVFLPDADVMFTARPVRHVTPNQVRAGDVVWSQKRERWEKVTGSAPVLAAHNRWQVTTTDGTITLPSDLVLTVQTPESKPEPFAPRRPLWHGGA